MNRTGHFFRTARIYKSCLTLKFKKFRFLFFQKIFFWATGFLFLVSLFSCLFLRRPPDFHNFFSTYSPKKERNWKNTFLHKILRCKSYFASDSLWNRNFSRKTFSCFVFAKYYVTTQKNYDFLQYFDKAEKTELWLFGCEGLKMNGIVIKPLGCKRCVCREFFLEKNFLFYDISKRRKFLMQFYLNGIAGRLCFPA